MAISHNLSIINDNLSCFDPVAQEADGISFGKGWLLWKIFEGMSTFDSNIKKITNTSPTPSFLQSEAGTTLQIEPAKNRTVNGDFIRFYMTNDAGLSQTPSSATIYEMSIVNYNYPDRGMLSFKIKHKIDGQSVYAPSNELFNTADPYGNYANTFYGVTFSYYTSTKAEIPKIIMWKSANANVMSVIDKVNGGTRGGLIWYNPIITGYRNNIGIITNGLNTRLTILGNIKEGSCYIEPFTQNCESSIGSIVSGLFPLCSAGSLPTNLFTFNNINNLIAGKLKFSMKNNTQIKLITDEIEGIILANPTAVSLSYNQIYKWNNKYYIVFGTINDKIEKQMILLELGT